MRQASERAVSAAGRATGWTLALLATAQLIISLDINIVFVALPEIGSGLGFDGQTLQWVVSAYVVFMGGFMLFGGRAADVLGQRRVFIAALWVYATSSLLGGLAWAPEVLIAARVFQGIGGAMLFPATLSLLNRLYAEGAARNRALAVWGGAGASGLTIGSLAGGVLTGAFGWPAVFYVNVPLAGIVALAAWKLIPHDPPQAAKRRFDLPGGLTITAAATLIVFTLVQGPETGWANATIVTTAILAVAFFVAFLLIERRAPDPLIPFRLFGNRFTVGGAATTFLYMGSFGALPYFLTVLLQDVHAFTPLQTGLAFLIPSAAILLGTQAGGKLTTSRGARAALLAGSVLGIAGTAWWALEATATGNLWSMTPGIVLSGLGQGIVWTAMWAAVGTGVADHEQGIASGIGSTTQNTGNAIGLAICVAISAAVAEGASKEAITAGSRAAIVAATAGIAIIAVVAAALVPTDSSSELAEP
ncbi:MFS transporter [Amycolatopsis albispora]|uniref:MFS transporter n=1 Tax=Amycolatopsis albispora TaxID=1804986 RepID=A0A344L053_9PSEU|nr:MFS transporter [Amycolatopsis albispora]AXB41427.1 MFS transporter [Amycolatopsis albispora]